jgi:hypothetical protein
LQCWVLTLETDASLACRLLPLATHMIVLLSRPVDETGRQGVSPTSDATVADTLLVDLTQIFRVHLQKIVNSGSSELDNCQGEVLHHLQRHLLHDEYAATWSVGLRCFAISLVEFHDHPLIPECVESLICLRDTQLSNGLMCQSMVDDAFSTLVQGVGLEFIWPIIRWHASYKLPSKGFEKGISRDRTWILQQLRNATLASQPKPLPIDFFNSSILKLARECDVLSAAKSSEKTLFHLQVVELWNLFSCFCKYPASIVSGFPPLTTTLIKAIGDKRYPELMVCLLHHCETQIL